MTLTKPPEAVDEPMYYGTTFDPEPVTHIGKMPTQVQTNPMVGTETPWIKTLCGRWCRASGETINSTECEPCEEINDAD